MVFQPSNSSPFWLSEAKREELRLDKLIDGRTTKCKYTKMNLPQDFKKEELLGAARSRGYSSFVRRTRYQSWKKPKRFNKGGGGTKRPFTGFVGAWMD
jgi:hypothetical protein